MTSTLDLVVAMFHALAEFLACKPIIYLFGAVIFCFVCKGLRSLMLF